MPTTATAELYFIAGAFVLIFIVCAVTVYVFFRQMKREKPPSAQDPNAAANESESNEAAAEEE